MYYSVQSNMEPDMTVTPTYDHQEEAASYFYYCKIYNKGPKLYFQIQEIEPTVIGDCNIVIRDSIYGQALYMYSSVQA